MKLRIKAQEGKGGAKDVKERGGTRDVKRGEVEERG